MLGKTVLLYTADSAGARRVTTCLRAAGTEVVVSDALITARDLISMRAVDLVLFDYALAADLSALAWAAAEHVPIVVLSENDTPEVHVDVICDHHIPHLLARSGQDSLFTGALREIVITTEKILRHDIFGADKYLPEFGVDLSTYEVHGATDRDELVECVHDYLGWLGAGREVRTAMSTVVDELVTNAVYNAPRDEHGRPRYASMDRREKVELDPWERAQVRFGSDGTQFVFSISDWFGALGPARIRSGLRRCTSAGEQFERKAGGAGLGLYTVLQSVGQLVINVEPGKRTEVIAIVDISNRMRGIRQGGHSLHLFTQRPAAEQHAGDTVVVSEELRRDLLASVTKNRGRGQVIPLVQPKRVAAAVPRQRGETLPDVPSARRQAARLPGAELVTGRGAKAVS
jgi:anti-sigma regulatory factor (Ser/Thr protein kinase)